MVVLTTRKFAYTNVCMVVLTARMFAYTNACMVVLTARMFAYTNCVSGCGDLKVDGGSCSVLADRVEGDIDVVNSYKYVILKNTSGSIHVRGDSSPIEVSQIRKLPAGAIVELFTSYKPVTLDLPGDANVTVMAKTQYGTIRSDFPVYLNAEDNKQAKIELGTGSGQIRIETSNDIIIRKG